MKKIKKYLRNNHKDMIVFFTIFIIVIIFIFGIGYFKHQKSQNIQKISSTSTTTEAIISSKEITRGDTSKKQVIFTFDGGSTIESSDKILEVLAKHHVKGTFFLTGKMIENHPDLVRRIASSGAEIFNHTYDHPDLTKIEEEKVIEELVKTESVLQKTAGVSSKPYFRAPYGARDSRVLDSAKKAGYQSVYWTKDALDWKEKQRETADQVKNRILSSIAPGNIYLMHVGDNITGNILDEVFTMIESRGYKLVSLTEGL